METKDLKAPVPIYPAEMDSDNLYRDNLPLNYKEIHAYNMARFKAEIQAKKQAEPGDGSP